MLGREKELEADIPPNRSQKYRSRKPSNTPKSPPVKSKQEPTRRRTIKNTKAAMVVDSEKVPTRIRKYKNNDKFKEINRLFNGLKPKYIYKGSSAKKEELDTPAALLPLEKRSFPPSLTLSKIKKLFEDHIMLSNTYLDLIQQVKQGFSSDAIDISSTHHFIPKNIDTEKQRFTINVGSDMTLPPSGNEFFFSTFDMDLFFNRQPQNHESQYRKVPLV